MLENLSSEVPPAQSGETVPSDDWIAQGRARQHAGRAVRVEIDPVSALAGAGASIADPDFIMAGLVTEVGLEAHVEVHSGNALKNGEKVNY